MEKVTGLSRGIGRGRGMRIVIDDIYVGQSLQEVEKVKTGLVDGHDDDDDSYVCSESTNVFFSLDEFHFEEKLEEEESVEFKDCVLPDSEVADRTNAFPPSSSGALEVFFKISEVIKNMEISQDEEETVTYDDVIPTFNDALSDKEKLAVITKIGKILECKVARGNGFGLISGPTGSGKSTTCSIAFLIHNLPFIKQENLKIFLSQPRVIAAKGLYFRFLSVCQSLSLTPNTFGLKTGQDDVNFNNCHFAVGTSGWLLVQLVHQPHKIYNYHTIIVDEVHEMSTDIELLMGIISALFHLHTTSVDNTQRFPDIVFVSATMQPDALFKYFRKVEHEMGLIDEMGPTTSQINAQVLSGINSHFHVKEMFLEDLLDEMHLPVLESIDEISDENEQPKLHQSIIEHMFNVIIEIYTNPEFEEYREGTVLVCLPGLGEIDNFIAYVEENLDSFHRTIEIVTYHGSLSAEELRLARERVKDAVGSSSVLLLVSTPISDSSLTIENCSVVLDSVLIKHMNMDRFTGIDVLEKYWADGFVQLQRKGRCGRTRNGLYIRFIPRNMKITSILTEMTRTNINITFMRIMKVSNLAIGRGIQGFVSRFFTEFLFSKPSPTHIYLTVQHLLNTGIIIRKPSSFDEIFPFDNYKVTQLGEIVYNFKTDPDLIRGCWLGNSLGCFETLSIIAADATDARSQFFHRSGPNLKMFHFKMKFALTIPSDSHLMAMMFRLWLKSPHTQRTDKKSKRRTIACSNFLPLEAPVEDFTNEHLLGCRLSSFSKLDDNLKELLDTFMKPSNGINSAVLYAQAGADVDRRRQARINNKMLELFTTALSTPYNYQFFSMPSYHFHPTKNNNVCLLNSVILCPAPPPESDCRQWGSQLMFELGKPTNILPNIYLDKANDRVIATFPPAAQHLYLGMIHPSVKEVLQRAQFSGAYFSEKIFYTLTTEDQTMEPNDILTSYSQSVIAKDPLFSDVFSCDEASLFNSSTVFVIGEFITPHNFGVRLYRMDSDPVTRRFVEMGERLIRSRHLFTQSITLSQVQLGTRVIVLDFKVPLTSSKWKQPYLRGVIINTIDEEVYSHEQLHIRNTRLINVDFIDLGITEGVRIQDVYLFHETDRNYGFPDLFSSLPRQGYRVSLSSIQPNYLFQWDWSSNSRMSMINKLYKREMEFKCTIRLDIEFSSQFNKRIIAKDIYPRESNYSFSSWCMRNGHAMKLENTLLDDVTLHVDGPEFCPRPLNTSTCSLYKERNQRLISLGLKEENEPKEDTTIFSHYFNLVFSPLEVDFLPVSNHETVDIRIKLAKESINACPLDHRLANSNMKVEEYDPLALVGKEFRVVKFVGTRLLLCPNSTILLPYNCAVPLLQMCIFPVIEVLQHNKKNVAVRLFRKSVPPHEFQLSSVLSFHYIISGQDIEDVEGLRYQLNQIHMNVKESVNLDRFRDRLLTLFQRRRNTFLPPNDVGFEYLDFPTISCEGFMKPEVIFTQV